MHIMHRRGWEIPEHQATPEHLFFDRRAFLAAAGAAAVGLSPAGAIAQRATDVPDPTADLYPAKRNETYKLDRPVTPEVDQHHLQQFLRIRLVEIDLARRPGAEAAAVDGQDRRHGGEAAGHRHRRPHPQDAARRAPLPPPLRRSVGHGDPVDRLPARQARRAGAPAVVGEIPADGNLPRSRDGERAARELVSLALHRRRDHGGGEQRPRLPGHRRLRQAGVEVRRARRCGSRCRGNTASSRSSRSPSSPSPTSGRRRSGRRCRPPNTASGPTSIRRSRIRAGARRPSR